MSEITYKSSSDKSFWVYADFDLYEKEMRELQGRYYKKHGRWSISKQRENELINLIERVNKVKNRKTQSKYRRAVSVSSESGESEKEESEKEESEKDESEEESEEESDKKSQQDMSPRYQEYRHESQQDMSPRYREHRQEHRQEHRHESPHEYRHESPREHRHEHRQERRYESPREHRHNKRYRKKSPKKYRRRRESPRKSEQLPAELLNYYQQFVKQPSRKNRLRVYSSNSSGNDSDNYEDLQDQLRVIKEKMRRMKN